MTSGLQRLQDALDAHEEPEDWPDDVCRDAWCGYWERNNGLYHWHTPADHDNRAAMSTDGEGTNDAELLIDGELYVPDGKAHDARLGSVLRDQEAVAGAGHIGDVPLLASEPNPPKAGR